MIEVFVEIVLILFGVVVVYEIVKSIICRVTGCSQRDAEDKIRRVINKMPDDFVIKNFIIGHKAKVKGMFLTEWKQ